MSAFRDLRSWSWCKGGRRQSGGKCPFIEEEGETQTKGNHWLHVASGPCLFLLRRRRKSAHHHARGDTQGEEITPYLKQEATAGCGGPSADLKSPRRGRRSPHNREACGERGRTIGLQAGRTGEGGVRMLLFEWQEAGQRSSLSLSRLGPKEI